MLVVEIQDVQPFEDHPWGFTGVFSKENGGGFLDEIYPKPYVDSSCLLISWACSRVLFLKLFLVLRLESLQMGKTTSDESFLHISTQHHIGRTLLTHLTEQKPSGTSKAYSAPLATFQAFVSPAVRTLRCFHNTDRSP